MPFHVTLPDGSPLELADGATALDAAQAIGPRLAKAAVAAQVSPGGVERVPDEQGRLVDLNAPLHDGDHVAIVTATSPEGLDVLRHSTSHVLAQAVLRLWPGAEYAIGPTIENGFYYDFLLPQPISDADLPRIEEEMAKIAAEDLPVARYEVPRDEALAVFEQVDNASGGTSGAERARREERSGGELAGATNAREPHATTAQGLPAGLDQPFKVELIEDLPEGELISIYTQGGFTDLCRGPHVPSTGRIGKGTFKLTSIAGAYWRGDEHNQMLTRIYGTAWPSKEELQAYLERLEEARRRDHRRIGRDLDLFSFHEEGPGFPFFHAKGMRLWNAMVDYWREEHVKAGYEEIRTPQILRRELWEMSGHWDNYKENMYFTEIDGQPFAVKPMNCPGGLLVYKSRRRSYRDLPLRMAELGQVHRHELSGVLHGLFRVRYFTQDDAHIYCTPEQLEDEVRGVLHLMLHIYAGFGFSDVRIELSTRGEKSIGSDEMWVRAESALRHVLEGEGIDYQLNPGDAAFYGPKIDFHIRDVMGRSWQCGTIQVDFAMPERLDITYTGPDNEEHRPVMVHRALLGSMERFMGILLEHYGGNLPTWLAPVQALVLPVSDRHAGYAVGVTEALRVAGLRAELDDRSESVGKRIRDGQLQKVPYLLVVGDREEGARAVSVRARGAEKGGVPIEEFVTELSEEVAERRLPEAAG
jgi:threonyl-tRNA synthetase